MTVNLDDLTKTSFCIPFKKPASTNKHNASYQSPFFPPTQHPSRDLPFPVGNELRLEAYRLAWGKCLGRMQELINDLQRSTINEVVVSVMDSDANSKDTPTGTLPGLPFPELPVIAVINPTFGPTLLHRIITQLETEATNTNAMDTDTDDPASPSSYRSCPLCIVIHLRAVDFPNVASGMKAVVAGFVDKAKDRGFVQGERKATVAAGSLAGYDIRSLEAWYRFLTVLKGKGEDVPRKLVVILHDFEQFDPCVMQDIFYICSHASSLPLTFILSLTSPLPSFLNTVYSASTLSLLRLRTIRAPSGVGVLNEVLRKTYFDVGFDPDIVIGPSVLEFLQDFFARHRSSIDVIFTVLQLAHMKHFTSDPLTALVHSMPKTQMNQPPFVNFLNSLRMRLGFPKSDGTDKSSSIATVVKAVDKMREAFYSRARHMRVGFGIMCTIQGELRTLGYKGLEWASEGDGEMDVMLDLLRGRLGRDVRQLGMIVKKLKAVELENILDKLTSYFFGLPGHARMQSEEQEARTQLTLLRTKLSQDFESHVEVGEELGEWLREYLSDKLRPLEELELWDLWYTRNMPLPSELLNPSVRACIVAGLSRPYEYAKALSPGEALSGSGSGLKDSKRKALWELPDTSILFKRYLDSGKMINVFDWFESFKGVLDVQRRSGTRAGEDEDAVEVSSRKKGKKSKGKGKAKENREAIAVRDEEDGDWKLEVQARFIRALHELDYLGFVKHTGRKRDHVVRTVFDVGDDEDDLDDEKEGATI